MKADSYRKGENWVDSPKYKTLSAIKESKR